MSVIGVTELGNSDFAVGGNLTSTQKEFLTAAIANNQHKFY
jgi:hypothetical protein